MKELKDLKLKTKKDLQAMDAAKLQEEIKSAEKTLYTLKIKLATGEQKQTHLVKAVRRYVAQARTYASQLAN